MTMDSAHIQYGVTDMIYTNPHIWNKIAKTLRENCPTDNSDESMIRRGTVVNIAMSFAKQFSRENKAFDSVKFLDQCSSDPERFPFSELWEEDHG